MRFWSIQGVTPYRDVWALQKILVDLRAQDACDDTVLFLEHASVVTRGRGLQFRADRTTRHMPEPVGLDASTECIDIERGGDLTVHSPGQLVIYPIVKLGASPRFEKKDIHAFLRGFEAWVIGALTRIQQGELSAESSVVAAQGKIEAEDDGDHRGYSSGELQTDSGATGIWLKTAAGKKKIASLGIAIRKWVTYHGMAINLHNDLSLFEKISPCGYSAEVMAHFEMPGHLSPQESRKQLEDILARAWGCEVERMEFRAITELLRSGD